MNFDILIRGGVLPSGVVADIGIADGKVAANAGSEAPRPKPASSRKEPDGRQGSLL